MKALVLEEYNKLVCKDVRGEYEVVLNLLESGMISVDDQISAVAPLSEGAVWFNKLYRKEEELNKIILVP